MLLPKLELMVLDDPPPHFFISDEVQLPGGWDPQQAELPLDDDPPKLLLKELDPPQFLI